MSCYKDLQRSDRTKLRMQLEIGPSATNEDRASLYKQIHRLHLMR
jgi:hypothetical protein